MGPRRIIVLGFSVVATVTGCSNLATPSEPPPPSSPAVRYISIAWSPVSPDQLASELTRQPVLVIDVGLLHIGGITDDDLHLPFDRIAAQAGALPPDPATGIVVYAVSDEAASMGVHALALLGYANVGVLEGGTDAWVAGGRRLTAPR